MNLIQIKHNLSPAVIRNENRREYFSLISKADFGDLKPFISFIPDQVITTQETIIAAVKGL